MEDMVQCPECDARFMVVWCNDGYSRPEYCPMCGVDRAWREAGDCHRRGRNVRERIVVIGQWSSPGEIGVNIHEA